jgi:hypothetical protein
VGRALRELGIQMIPAYSPEARGRSERSFSTWQGRLPQELRLRGITTVEAANRFLDKTYIGEFNRRFQVAAVQPGTVFCRWRRRTSTASSRSTTSGSSTATTRCNLKTAACRSSRSAGAALAGCAVTVRQHLDGDLSLS